MQPINDIKDFTNSFKACKVLRKNFNLDYITDKFDPQQDLDTYLCALAYGSVGLEIFEDEKTRRYVTAQELKDEKFAEGMLKQSILSKINRAKGIINSDKFQKTGIVDFRAEHDANDYATIYFATYYLRTQGYVVKTNPNHNTDYPPFALDFNGNLSFKKGRQVSHNRILKQVAETLKTNQSSKGL